MRAGKLPLPAAIIAMLKPKYYNILQESQLCNLCISRSRHLDLHGSSNLHAWKSLILNLLKKITNFWHVFTNKETLLGFNDYFPMNQTDFLPNPQNIDEFFFILKFWSQQNQKRIQSFISSKPKNVKLLQNHFSSKYDKNKNVNWTLPRTPYQWCIYVELSTMNTILKAAWGFYDKIPKVTLCQKLQSAQETQVKFCKQMKYVIIQSWHKKLGWE